MKLYNGFVIKDLIEYERQCNNIISDICNNEYFVFIDLIDISYKCGTEIAIKKYKEWLNKYSLETILKSTLYEVIGRESCDSDDKQSTDEVISLTKLLNQFYSDIHTIDENFSHTDFLNMTTEEMFNYVDDLKKIIIRRENIRMRQNYTDNVMLINMIGASLSKDGKIPSCPEIDDDGQLINKSINSNTRINKGKTIDEEKRRMLFKLAEEEYKNRQCD